MTQFVGYQAGYWSKVFNNIWISHKSEIFSKALPNIRHKVSAVSLLTISLASIELLPLLLFLLFLLGFYKTHATENYIGSIQKLSNSSFTRRNSQNRPERTLSNIFQWWPLAIMLCTAGLVNISKSLIEKLRRSNFAYFERILRS